MQHDHYVILITSITTILASGGFWAYMQKRSDKKDQIGKLLLGLAHDRIIYLGMSYIERGSLSHDEYENLYDYLYLPYKDMGGNGAAERIVKEIEKLPIKKEVK